MRGTDCGTLGAWMEGSCSDGVLAWGNDGEKKRQRQSKGCGFWGAVQEEALVVEAGTGFWEWSKA